MGRRGEEGPDYLTEVSTKISNKGSLQVFCPRCIVKSNSLCEFPAGPKAKQHVF